MQRKYTWMSSILFVWSGLMSGMDVSNVGPACTVQYIGSWLEYLGGVGPCLLRNGNSQPVEGILIREGILWGGKKFGRKIGNAGYVILANVASKTLKKLVFTGTLLEKLRGLGPCEAYAYGCSEPFNAYVKGGLLSAKQLMVEWSSGTWSATEYPKGHWMAELCMEHKKKILGAMLLAGASAYFFNSRYCWVTPEKLERFEIGLHNKINNVMNNINTALFGTFERLSEVDNQEAQEAIAQLKNLDTTIQKLGDNTGPLIDSISKKVRNETTASMVPVQILLLLEKNALSDMDLRYEKELELATNKVETIRKTAKALRGEMQVKNFAEQIGTAVMTTLDEEGKIKEQVVGDDGGTSAGGEDGELSDIGLDLQTLANEIGLNNKTTEENRAIVDSLGQQHKDLATRLADIEKNLQDATKESESIQRYLRITNSLSAGPSSSIEQLALPGTKD